MGIIIKQSIRNAILSYLGIILGFVSIVFLFPSILGAEKLGLTRTMIAITLISSQLINLGIPNSIIKFLPTLKLKSSNPQGLFWVFMIPPLIGIILFAIIFLTFKTSILGLYADATMLGNFYIFVIPLVASYAAFSLLNSFIKASFDTVVASFLQEILLRVVVIINLGLFFFELIDFEIFIVIFVANYTLQYLLLFIYALKKGYINFKPDFKVFDKNFKSEISKYSIFTLFSGLTLSVVGNIDLIMVDIFTGLEQTGIYAVALYVGSVIAIPKRAVVKISFPIISTSFEENDLANIEAVYKQSSLNQFLIGFLIYIGVIANIDNLFALLPEEFASGGIVIIIIGLANLFDLATGANGQIIISSKYYRFDLLATSILVCSAIILNAILIPLYGLAGAASATAVSIFIYNFSKMLFVWLKFKMQPFTSKIIGVILAGTTILALSFLLPKIGSLVVDIFVRSIIIASLYLASIKIFNLSNEINKLIDTSFDLLRKLYK